MTVQRWNAEGGTSGNTVKTSDTGSGTAPNTVAVGTGASLKYDNSQSAHGTQSVALKGASGTATYMQWTLSGTQLAVAIYWNPGPTLPSALIRLIDIRAAGTILRLQTTTGNKFQVQEGGGTTAVYSPASAFLANTWYRLELVLSTISASAGAYKFDYYLLDASSPVETGISKTAGNVGTAAITSLAVGSFASSTFTGTSYIDDVAYNVGSTTYIGALPSTGVTYQAAPCTGGGDGFPGQTIVTYSAVAEGGSDLVGGSASPTPPSVAYQAPPCTSGADISPGSQLIDGNVTIVIPPDLPGEAEVIEITGIVTVS